MGLYFSDTEEHAKSQQINSDNEISCEIYAKSMFLPFSANIVVKHSPPMLHMIVT